MPPQPSNVWGIHANKQQNAEALFLQENIVAIGWKEVGDLKVLPSNREAFKAKVAATYPDSKQQAVAINAGQLYRFVHEVQVGDIAVYASPSRQVCIGKVAGPYCYAPEKDENYPNQRAVQWLKTLPRTTFSQGALYELGSAMSLFLIKNYAQEFVAALSGQVTPVPIEADETVSHVATDIEETTRDFVLKRLSQELKGHPLADFVAHLLGTMGYRCRVSPPGPDGGIDILAHKDELGFEPPIIKVQVKSTSGSIGVQDVQALYGVVADKEYGLLVTLGTFSPQALNFARSRSNLRLIDGTELVDLTLLHYEDFDSRYKGLLPLKRVYVPEPIEEGNA